MEESKAMQIPSGSPLANSRTATAALMTALARTISFRAGTASPEYLKMMADRLLKENPEYTAKALTNLGERKRQQGETAQLDLGSILAEISAITPVPKSRYRIEADAQLEERRQRIAEVEREHADRKRAELAALSQGDAAGD